MNQKKATSLVHFYEKSCQPHHCIHCRQHHHAQESKAQNIGKCMRRAGGHPGTSMSSRKPDETQTKYSCECMPSHADAHLRPARKFRAAESISSAVDSWMQRSALSSRLFTAPGGKLAASTLATMHATNSDGRSFVGSLLHRTCLAMGQPSFSAFWSTIGHA